MSLSSLATEGLLFSLSSETTSLIRLARSGSSVQEEVRCGLGFPKQEKLKPTALGGGLLEAPIDSHSEHPALKPSKSLSKRKPQGSPKNWVRAKKHSAWFVSSPKSGGVPKHLIKRCLTCF